MKTCFVSMPYGVKTDSDTGRFIDFDKIYHDLIVPAISDSLSFRIEEASSFSEMQKNIVQSIISCDIMIVDLTTQNPNVLYELGMRHMAQRGLTIMICSSGSKIPSNIAAYKVISYLLNDQGNVDEESKLSFQQLLRYSIDSSLEQITTDSPVYQLFPEIKISFPEELNLSDSKLLVLSKSNRKKSIGPSGVTTRNASLENLKEFESQVLNEPDDVDPIDFVNLLKNYRNISAWKDLVNLAETMPKQLMQSPEVQQLYALSLNRLGDYDKAIGVMEDLVKKTGGDAETYGILGRIYKDLYEKNKNDDSNKASYFLDKAITNYRSGFEKQPNDYYTGVNVVNLLTQRDDSRSKSELEIVLPKVREALDNKLKDGAPDYWDFATATELATIAKEWNIAERQAVSALKQDPQNWMLETTLRNLSLLKSTMKKEEQIGVNNIMNILENGMLLGEQSNA